MGRQRGLVGARPRARDGLPRWNIDDAIPGLEIGSIIISKILLANSNKIFFQSFANFWRVRSRLYRNRCLQVNMRLTAFSSSTRFALMRLLEKRTEVENEIVKMYNTEKAE